MLENIRFSFEEIWSHKLRSLLTVLGIIIGIASIITIVSTIKGTNEQIKENLIGAGNNVVTVRLTQEGYEYDFQWLGNPQGVSVISSETLAALLDLDDVEAVSAYHYRSNANDAYYGNSGFNGALYGIGNDYLATCGYQVMAGRAFSADDVTSCHKVALVDETCANKLFAGENPLGKTIELGGEPFTIIGVVKLASATAPTINSLSDYEMYANTSGGALFINDACWAMVARYDEPQNLAVRASSTDAMTKVGKAVADLVNGAHVSASELTYQANDLLGQASSMQDLANSTNKQLIWIAGISLLVGGIGVMNIMMVSVTERTREIGLKKAIGARRKRILMQFLTEAGILTAIGGVMGVLLGIGFAKMLSMVMGTPTAISAPACLVAVLFSTVIGLAFGLAPAVKASKLNPIDALNHE